jgi:hypothetical protein
VPRRSHGGAAGVPLPAAVLWDMDGTLVDTEPYWIESEFELVEQHGGTWSSEHALNLVGNDLLVSGRYIREHGGIDLSPDGSSRSCSTVWWPGSASASHGDRERSSCLPTSAPTACAARW